MNWQNRRMRSAQYREAIEVLGMNTAQAGRFLGVSRKTAYRYHDGDSLIPAPISLLLRLMIETGAMPVVPPFQGVRAKRKLLQEYDQILAVRPRSRTHEEMHRLDEIEASLKNQSLPLKTI